MNRLKRELDCSFCHRNEDLKKIDVCTKRNVMNIMNKIDNDYLVNVTDPILNNSIQNIPFPRRLILKKEKISINREITSLDDLLKIIDDFPISFNIEYSIDIAQLIKIKEPLVELNNMIGMACVKNSILDQIIFYIQNLHHNGGMDYKHTVIYGPPGSGKTEVAKILGKIFSKLGILKNESFKKVTRADLIAGYLGQTALKTRGVINESLDGVLFIDEAYALGNTEKRDSFAKECIDTICEALSDHKENLMVIVAGYKEELDTCFFSYNQGLKSRFPWVFETEKYRPIDLKNIFIKKINDINWKLEDDLNLSTFEKNKDLFKFYGRDMEILLLKTKIAHSRRIFGKSEDLKTFINNSDLENGIELFKKHTESEPSNYQIHRMYS